MKTYTTFQIEFFLIQVRLDISIQIHQAWMLKEYLTFVAPGLCLWIFSFMYLYICVLSCSDITLVFFFSI